jgi:hypothetical protein
MAQMIVTRTRPAYQASFDIALRGFGLMLGAPTLARLSAELAEGAA